MLNSTRIMLVAEEEAYSAFLARALSSMGFFCETRQAKDFSAEYLEANQIEVTLIDASSMSHHGFELLARFEEEQIDTIPILLARKDEITDRMAAARLGAFDIVQKPLERHALCQSIERARYHHRLGKRAQRMTAQADFWQTTFDVIPDLIFLVDAQHHILRANKALAEFVGMAVEDLIGQLCYRTIGGRNAPPRGCPHGDVLCGARQCCATPGDGCLGKDFQVTASAVSTDSPMLGTVVVARDISAQRRMYDEIARSHMELERLLSAMSSFLIEIDCDHRIVRWNTAAEHILGVPAAEALGRSLTDETFAWTIGARNVPAGTFLKSMGTFTRPMAIEDMRVTRPDGSEAVLGINVNPILDEHGHRLGYFLMGLDITERKNLEAQLVQAQKLESIGQLAAGIAHEINTPTQYVGDNIEFLQFAFKDIIALLNAYQELLAAIPENRATAQMAKDLSEQVEEAGVDYLVEQIPRALEQSHEGVGRISEIVRAMKEFSHPGSEEKTPLDINRAIQSTITVARNEWKYVAEMVTDFESGLPMVPVLPGEFNQVILNMLVNAAHAIGDVVKDGSQGKGTITVRTRLDGDGMTIAIADTGSGIPKDILGKIFDPFFTTKRVGRGTGQGLAISHNVIVEKHKGSISVDTKVGRGTTFLIRLPLTMDEAIKDEV